MNYKYDVFISFSSKEKELSKMLWKILSKNNLKVFHSDVSLVETSGESWIESLEKSLAESQHMVVILSEKSISSKWVKAEYRAFFNNYYNGKDRLLIPFISNDFKESNIPIFLKEIQSVNENNVDALLKKLLNNETIQLSFRTKYFKKKYIKIIVTYLSIIILLIVLLFIFDVYKDVSYQDKIVNIHSKYSRLRGEYTKVIANKTKSIDNIHKSLWCKKESKKIIRKLLETNDEYLFYRYKIEKYEKLSELYNILSGLKAKDKENGIKENIVKSIDNSKKLLSLLREAKSNSYELLEIVPNKIDSTYDNLATSYAILHYSGIYENDDKIDFYIGEISETYLKENPFSNGLFIHYYLRGKLNEH